MLEGARGEEGEEWKKKKGRRRGVSGGGIKIERGEKKEWENDGE